MPAASPPNSEPAREALARQLLLALAFGALGALGTLAGAHGPDPLAALAWIAILALPCGLACGALALRPWPFAASVPALWMMELALAGAFSERTLGTPLFAALGWTGIFAAGWGIGRGFGVGARSVAVGACFSILLAVLPSAGAFLDRPWPPSVAARLLDVSPVAICMECAGVIDPGLRQPFRGKLAGPALLLLGCALAAFGAVRARAQERASS